MADANAAGQMSYDMPDAVIDEMTAVYRKTLVDDLRVAYPDPGGYQTAEIQRSAERAGIAAVLAKMGADLAAVERWIKRRRDLFADESGRPLVYEPFETLDNLLDDFRMHMVTGTSLDDEVAGPHGEMNLGPNYRQCPRCTGGAMSQPALDAHISRAHPEAD